MDRSLRHFDSNLVRLKARLCPLLSAGLISCCQLCLNTSAAAAFNSVLCRPIKAIQRDKGSELLQP